MEKHVWWKASLLLMHNETVTIDNDHTLSIMHRKGSSMHRRHGTWTAVKT